ncbi:unnamed protein product, partial [Ixodes hexagonus]
VPPCLGNGSPLSLRESQDGLDGVEQLISTLPAVSPVRQEVEDSVLEEAQRVLRLAIVAARAGGRGRQGCTVERLGALQFALSASQLLQQCRDAPAPPSFRFTYSEAPVSHAHSATGRASSSPVHLEVHLAVPLLLLLDLGPGLRELPLQVAQSLLGGLVRRPQLQVPGQQRRPRLALRTGGPGPPAEPFIESRNMLPKGVRGSICVFSATTVCFPVPSSIIMCIPQCLHLALSAVDVSVLQVTVLLAEAGRSGPRIHFVAALPTRRRVQRVCRVGPVLPDRAAFLRPLLPAVCWPNGGEDPTQISRLFGLACFDGWSSLCVFLHIHLGLFGAVVARPAGQVGHYAAVIKVVRFHATLLPARWRRPEAMLANVYTTLQCCQTLLFVLRFPGCSSECRAQLFQLPLPPLCGCQVSLGRTLEMPLAVQHKLGAACALPATPTILSDGGAPTRGETGGAPDALHRLFVAALGCPRALEQTVGLSQGSTASASSRLRDSPLPSHPHRCTAPQARDAALAAVTVHG